MARAGGRNGLGITARIGDGYRVNVQSVTLTGRSVDMCSGRYSHCWASASAGQERESREGRLTASLGGEGWS